MVDRSRALCTSAASASSRTAGSSCSASSSNRSCSPVSAVRSWWLACSATRLGDGDFSLATPRSGVPEIDAIASSLDRSAERVEQLLKAERGFSEHASHQLRTALTGLQLRLEELAEHDDPAVREEAEAALVQSARGLLSTIEELLALGVRTGRAGNVVRFDLGDLVRQHVDDVEPILTREGRRAVVEAPPVEVVATLGAVGQALDILLSNAVRHGAGAVTATVAADERRVGRHRRRGAGPCGDRRLGVRRACRHRRARHRARARAHPRDDRRRHDHARTRRAARVPHRAAARLTESLPEAGRSEGPEFRRFGRAIPGSQGS